MYIVLLNNNNNYNFTLHCTTTLFEQTFKERFAGLGDLSQW